MSDYIKDKVYDARGDVIRHGKYSYYLDVNTGVIYRSLTADVGKRWIDADGNQFDSWGIICTL